jgi:metacaspase-1
MEITRSKGNQRRDGVRGTARGVSIHIGLNHVDPNEYQDENGDPWDGELAGCINDARAMQEIAVAQGFQSTLMTDDQATSAQVLRSIGRAAQELSAGDILLVTYSGHGGQVPDVNGDEDEAQDETWCLFDRMLIDDELYQMWSQFEAGVRIFVLSDSCHSGTVVKDTIYSQIASLPPLMKQYERGKTARVGARVSKYRNLPREVEKRTYQAHAAMYDTFQWLAGRGKRATVGASVLLISGCMDNQLSADGDGNGLFTATLLEVWNNGGFNGSYETFWRAIQERMPPTQTPNYYKAGVQDPNFEGQKPFTIGESAGNGQTGPSPTRSQPSISAEADTMTRDDDPPRFQVSPGANPYYIFEIAAEVDLFANRPDGNTSEFFATYYDAESPDRLTGSSYALPDYAWEALKGADRLYYRIGTTSSQSGWDDYTLSSDDGASDTPSIEITAGEVGGEEPGGGGTGMPSISAEADTMTRDDDPPRFQVSPGANPYYIFEIAAEVDLFANRPDGNTSEFFATYYDAESPDRLTGSSYALPDYAWEALKGADRLYYRIGTTSSQSGWDDYTLSSDDGASDTPSIEITAGGGRIPPTRKAPTARAARRTATTPPPTTGAGASPWTAGSPSIEEALRASGMPASPREAAGAV